jgi:hypothetical protein
MTSREDVHDIITLIRHPLQLPVVGYFSRPNILDMQGFWLVGLFC